MTEYITTITAPEHGGPEVYTSESAPKPTPDDGQLLVRLTVSGVNYLDVSQRTGATPLQAPFAAGWRVSASLRALVTASPDSQ